jgi:hypothetical protein
MERKPPLYRFLPGIFAALVPLVLLVVPVQAAGPLLPTWQYTLGRGLTVGNTGLNIGGFASVEYEDLRDEPQRFSLSTFSILISWDLWSRVRLFSELEFEDPAIVQEGRRFGSRGDSFEIQRLYADVFASDALSLRVGKFLTPVGRWNEIHAAPLVWTTSRPSVTFRSFAEDTTGGMLRGTLTPFGHDLEYSLYAAFLDELDPDEEEGTSEFEKEVGFQVRYYLGSVALGASYLHFLQEEEIEQEFVGEEEVEEEEIERTSRDNLLGLDFFWSRNRYELSGEFTYRFGDKGTDNVEWGLFLQGVAPLTRRLYGIGRYEFFDPAGPVPGAHLWVMAVAFRPIPPLIVKAEYSVAYNNFADVPAGFATSIAILF